jgi:plasmid stabilization system protein ParE
MKNENIYTIIISQRAEDNLDTVINYLLIEWNENVKNKFLKSFKRIIHLLSINPFMFKEYSKKKRIRKCLITKHNAMFYRIVDYTVEIITIHDTRKKPNSLIL